MTARDELAALFERRIIGEDPDDRRYERALRQAASELDDLASLATNPETAPVVFRWLVEAGVLTACDPDDDGAFVHYHPTLAGVEVVC